MWWCNCINLYILHTRGNICKISDNVAVRSEVKQPRGRDCSRQHPVLVWCPAWVVVFLCVKRWMCHSSQRWAGVTSSVLGRPHVHMPQSCETKNPPTTTNHNKLHCADCVSSWIMEPLWPDLKYSWLLLRGSSFEGSCSACENTVLFCWFWNPLWTKTWVLPP